MSGSHGTCMRYSKGPFFEISDLLRHFLVEFGIGLFLHNLGTLILNLPHAKLYFVFFLLKIKKKIAFLVAPNFKMFLMKYCISLPNLVFSSQNAQLFCSAAVMI